MTNISEEIGKEKWYQINDAECKYFITRDERAKRIKSGKVRHLKTRMLNVGGDRFYHSFVIRENGKSFTKYFHRELAKIFVPNSDPDTKTQVNHIDGNTQNNAIENLEWVTQRENINHAWNVGLCRKGKATKCRVTTEIINSVKSLLSLGIYNQREVADIVSINPSHVSRINNNKLFNRKSINHESNN